ncbi:uncharacterized protein Bfra_010628 [Botrytis fragariae]|uniref:Uncharacterized protein n=1 Tax=Botrytis fragariae TaxID=1964551 RepID=A0A8H6AFN5_9HELO|nr:uncharacterized protein Bfra_010628 [Botrytis fragariae]KAF5867653.1 hypothetical protein Bfra_010628 [Botrytis fragariae]
MARKSDVHVFAHGRTQNHELLENQTVNFTDIYLDVHVTAMRELMMKSKGLATSAELHSFFCQTQDQPAMIQRTPEAARERS